MTSNNVLDIVEQTVNDNQSKKFRLRVLRPDIRHEGRWWYVGVAPEKDDIRVYEYDRVLRRVEHIIERKHNINVLLVPAIPD